MATNYRMGEDGFIWFVGVVEDRNDPSQLGRVKVRCINFHTENLNDLPTADLPWATVMLPTTATGNSGLGSNPFIVEGTWVVGFFMDATTKQQPVIMGTIPGRPKNLGDITKGFNDPNEREKEPGVSIYPTEKEEVDIDKLARGENTIDKTTGQTIEVPIALSDDEKTNSGYIEWKEPNSAYKATYPYNRVFKTESGHVKEYDDTEGEERIHEYHKAGTFYEIDKDGNKVTRIIGDNYEVIHGVNYVNVKGNVNLTIDSNCNTFIKGNWNIEVGGNKTELVTGTVSETYKKTKTENVTGAVSETYQDTKTEKVTGVVSETYEADQTTKITGNLDVDAAKIDLN